MDTTNSAQTTDDPSTEQSGQADTTTQTTVFTKEDRAWSHYRRTGCVLPGYSQEIAQRLADCRDQDQNRA